MAGVESCVRRVVGRHGRIKENAVRALVRVSSTFCVVAERAGRVETRRLIPQNKVTTSAHELGERAAEDGERAPHIPVRLEVAERPRIEQAAEEDAKEEQYRGDRLVGGMLLRGRSLQREPRVGAARGGGVVLEEVEPHRKRRAAAVEARV